MIDTNLDVFYIFRTKPHFPFYKNIYFLFLLPLLSPSFLQTKPEKDLSTETEHKRKKDGENC